jgi:hypothetical protein
LIKGIYPESAQGNFKVVDTVGVPHTYCIGSLHMKYNDTMIMDGDSIKRAEEKGASCYICKAQYKQGAIPKILSYEEHKEALLIECKVEIQPPPQELTDYLKTIKDECEKNGYVGFAFQKAKPTPSPEPITEKRIKLVHTENPQQLIHKVLYIGKIPKYDGYHNPDLHIKVETTTRNGYLEFSASGVIGAKENGNSIGGCGQIDMEFKHRDPKQDDKRTRNHITPDQIKFAPEWDASLWYDLLDIWHKWHLNGSASGCEHQEQLWDFDKEITFIEYRLKEEFLSSQGKLKDGLIDKLTKEGQASVPEELQEMLKLKYTIKRSADNPLPPELTPYYEEKSRENKNVSWVYPIGSKHNTYGSEEHPNGLLTKPCPVCGYEYGTSHKVRELPQEVVQFINDLPPASKQPVWI